MSPETESTSWVGEDVSLRRNMLIDPHRVEIARVTSNKNSFPYELAEEDETRFSTSMRSRYAQIGLIPADFAPRFALEAYFNAEDHNNFEFQLPITNLAEAPIFLPAGTKLLRFYVPPEEFIENGELLELVRDNVIEIDGKEQQDWRFVYKKVGATTEKDIVGIALKIKEEGRGYIPPSREPMSINGTEKQYRAEVDRFLRPVEGIKNPELPRLWIGETAPLNLNGLVTAEIEREAFPGFQGNTLKTTTGEHIDSRLVDPSTGWPVRVELYSPTKGEHVADWVVFKFFH